jgi:hypothetical protein
VKNDESATARVFRARSDWAPSSALVSRAQWMRDCEPRFLDDDADRIWTDATESLLGSSSLSPSSQPFLLAASSFTGGNILKVTAELAHPSQPSRIQAKIAIDTQSDVTTALREYLTDVREIVPDPDQLSGVGGESSFNEEVKLLLQDAEEDFNPRSCGPTPLAPS